VFGNHILETEILNRILGKKGPWLDGSDRCGINQVGAGARYFHARRMQAILFYFAPVSVRRAQPVCVYLVYVRVDGGKDAPKMTVISD